MNRWLALSVAVLAALVGCATDEPPAGGDVSLHARLATRAFLTLEPSSAVGLAAYDLDGTTLECAQPALTGGQAILRSSEELLLVEKLEIDLSDVVITPAATSARLALTDVRLRLGTQLVIEPTWAADGHAVRGGGTADVLLDWALVTPAGPSPLATQRLRDVELYVDVTRGDDHTVTATVTAEVAGFVDRVEVHDFRLAVSATSTEVAAVEVR